MKILMQTVNFKRQRLQKKQKKRNWRQRKLEILRGLSCFKVASSAAIALPATPLLDRIVDQGRENLVTRDQHSMSDNRKLTSHLVPGNLIKIDLPQATMLHT